MKASDFLTKGQDALVLSTLAGLSTTIGGLIAIIRKPNESSLAFLLGLAIGVMATVSIVELVIKNAIENNPYLVCAAAILGGLVFYILEPLIPTFEPGGHSHDKANHDGDKIASGRQQEAGKRMEKRGKKKSNGDTRSPPASPQTKPSAAQPAQQHDKVLPSHLIRLGLLMAVTMTLHNLPEGFAVAFSAFTKLGPIMTIAIAVHNIPEGIIVAAPIYAATGSRWKALGLAAASGLSEPLGAFMAVMLLRPETVEHYVHYLLAVVGGIMLSVCYLELWPEGRKCRADGRLAQGIVLGSIIMAWTLVAGG